MWRPMNQDIALSNARDASIELSRRRVEREAVYAFIDRLDRDRGPRRSNLDPHQPKGRTVAQGIGPGALAVAVTAELLAHPRHEPANQSFHRREGQHDPPATGSNPHHPYLDVADGPR